MGDVSRFSFGFVPGFYLISWLLSFLAFWPLASFGVWAILAFGFLAFLLFVLRLSASPETPQHHRLFAF